MLIKLKEGDLYMYIVEETGDVFLAQEDEEGNIVINRGDVENGEYETADDIVLVVEDNKLVKVIEPVESNDVLEEQAEQSPAPVEASQNCKCGQGTKKVQDLEKLVESLTEKIEILEQENKKLESALNTLKVKQTLNFKAEKPKSFEDIFKESALSEFKKKLN